MVDLLLEQTDLSQYVVILANGSFPRTDLGVKAFKQAAKLICCDGAAQKAFKNGRTPDYIVGDCDSVSSEIAKKFDDRIIKVLEQETNDLSKAFRFCLSKGWTKLLILGATGEREDHTLGNLSLLVDFAQKVADVAILSDRGVFYVATKSDEFKTEKGRQISIFSFDPTQEITSSGLKYPLDKLRLPRWFMGTLNEALADTFTLTFDSASPLLIFSPFTKEEE